MGRDTTGVRGMECRPRAARSSRWTSPATTWSCSWSPRTASASARSIGRVPQDQPRRERRQDHRLTERKGGLAGALVVRDHEELVFISVGGMVQRTPAAGHLPRTGPVGHRRAGHEPQGGGPRQRRRAGCRPRRRRGLRRPTGGRRWRPGARRRSGAVGRDDPDSDIPRVQIAVASLSPTWQCGRHVAGAEPQPPPRGGRRGGREPCSRQRLRPRHRPGGGHRIAVAKPARGHRPRGLARSQGTPWVARARARALLARPTPSPLGARGPACPQARTLPRRKARAIAPGRPGPRRRSGARRSGGRSHSPCPRIDDRRRARDPVPGHRTDALARGPRARARSGAVPDQSRARRPSSRCR